MSAGGRLPITSAIETLELPNSNEDGLFSAGRWMALYYPNLRTFIAKNSEATHDLVVSEFWGRHKGLERIELGLDRNGRAGWFPHMFHGCFPNLRALKV